MKSTSSFSSAVSRSGASDTLVVASCCRPRIAKILPRFPVNKPKTPTHTASITVPLKPKSLKTMGSRRNMPPPPEPPSPETRSLRRSSILLLLGFPRQRIICSQCMYGHPADKPVRFEYLIGPAPEQLATLSSKPEAEMSILSSP